MQSISIPDWSLGINTALPPTEVADNEAQDLLNLEFDDGGNLSSRRGFTELLSTTYAGRITSLHYFIAESGEIGIIYTTGSQVRMVETNGTGDANLAGSLTLPSDTFWQWKTFGDLAIGVNKATSGDNPIKVNTSGVASLLDASAPRGKYIETWNNRAWISGASEPNTLYGSELGVATNWTVPGSPAADDPLAIEVDPGDGDIITGLFATRGALYVFKRRRIFKIVPIDAASPATDATNLKVEIHAQTIGCVSPYSIQPILDDVVFLSEQGLASLSLAATTDDFRTALYSRKVVEISRTPKTTEEIPAYLFPDVAQLWLSIPASISLTGQAQVYVMDFLRIDQGSVRWTRFDGLAAFTAATSFTGASGKVYVVGAMNPDGDYQLYTYEPRKSGGTLSDNGAAYTKRLVTKAFSANVPLMRKHWHKWAYGFSLLSNSAQVAVQYYFDENLTKGGSYSFNLSGNGEGALWDSGVWDVSSWDSSVIVPQDIVRKFLSNSSGQRSQNVTFIVSNGQDNEGVTIKQQMIWYSLLSEKKVSEI